MTDRKDQIDILFEYLMNKRRKYDGNTLVLLAVKFESLDAFNYLMSQPLRWRVDLKTKNREGFAAIHLAVKLRNRVVFDGIASHSASLVVPVGLQYAYPSPANIPMYEDTLTLIAALPRDPSDIENHMQIF
jgi:ankyrin repeat protein